MNGMSNFDLNDCLHNYYPKFIGVFSADTNPLTNFHSFPCCFIMNTIPKGVHLDGHWIAFYCPNSNSIEFFDSLAKSPKHYPCFKKYFSNFTITHSSHIKLQSKFSTLCGEFCTTFLSLRCHDLSFTHIIKLITSYPNGYSRESFVNRFRLLNK